MIIRTDHFRCVEFILRICGANAVVVVVSFVLLIVQFQFVAVEMSILMHYLIENLDFIFFIYI